MIPHLLEDAHQKYGNTVIAIREGKKEIPFWVEQVVQGDKVVHFKGQTTDGKMWTPHTVVVPGDDVELQLGLPEVGAINVKDTVLYLWRRPLRQWTRGFSDTTISQFCANRQELVAMQRRSPGLMNQETLWHVFNPEYPSAQNAYHQVDSLDYLGRAWNYKYYFAVRARSPKIMVGYKRNLIGWAEDARHVVLLNRFEHLKEELGQYVNVEVRA